MKKKRYDAQEKKDVKKVNRNLIRLHKDKMEYTNKPKASGGKLKRRYALEGHEAP